VFVSVLLFMQRLVLKSFRWRRLVIGATIIGATAASYLYFFSSGSADIEGRLEHRQEDLVLCLPSREKQLSKLKSNTLFDVLVIGGGSVGAGVALDATTRGLQVALVEREDFASGTSSRSTKLIHGGVRINSQYVFNSLSFSTLRTINIRFERKLLIFNRNSQRIS